MCTTMEDGRSVYAVYDGHGGTEISRWLAKHFAEMLIKEPAYIEGNFEKAMHDVNFSCDKEFENEDEGTVEELWELRDHNNDGQNYQQEYWPKAGATATILLIVPDKGDHGMAYYSNAGDARTIRCFNGQAFKMSDDHKPDDKEEKARITRADGRVLDGRVDGFLAVSRAIGDLEYKSDDDFPQNEQKVVCTPDIVAVPLNEVDFFFMACDGIWDHKTNQQAMDDMVTQIYGGDFAANRGKVSTEKMLEGLHWIMHDVNPKEYGEDVDQKTMNLQFKELKPDNTSALIVEIKKK